METKYSGVKVSVGDTFAIKNLNNEVIEQFTITDVWTEKKPVGFSHTSHGTFIKYSSNEMSDNDIDKGEIRASSPLAREVLGQIKGHTFKWPDEKGNDAQYVLLGVVSDIEFDETEFDEEEIKAIVPEPEPVASHKPLAIVKRKPVAVTESTTEDALWDSYMAQAETYVEPEYEEYLFEEPESYRSSVLNKTKYSSSQEALKTIFGYDSFRPGQKEIVDNILNKRDTFVVMPTGAGKSVCFQIPAVMLEGITIVISPLISLMQDQVKALNETGIASAFINSSLTEDAFIETLRNARRGMYKLIYVAPERLENEGFRNLADNIDISMVTVDEAHCISQWGQDFRPSYSKIVDFISELKKRPVISAFTATATEVVREDIICSLGLKEPFIKVTGFDRQNLFFQVDKPKNKDQYILGYVEEHKDESGIIYCSTRKNVDKVYELLKNRGYSVAKYHAGMSNQERKKMQDDFVYDYTSIVVATNAFGMGIDKSNVRYVIHYNMPQSMENYYQEAGRAGRDGLDSKCILLFSAQDIMINRFLLDHKDFSEIDPSDVESIRERDMARLRSMEVYCNTTDCLRNYILDYFGEETDKPCDNCGNCLREFEEIDMTNEAKQVINCVYEARGRYGKNLIIDTLAGARTARIAECGMNSYKTYGVLSKTNKNMLKRLVTQMEIESYLFESGEYHLLKIGPAMENLKDPDVRVLLKVSEEEKKPEAAAKSKKARKTDSLTSDGFKLFEILRNLRLEIARAENMPPYIVFSDKTLIDMCVKMPVTESDFLNVSGVGYVKYEKYGERFKEKIQEFLNNNPRARSSE